MTNYVRQQSAGDILRNSVTIYRSNFLALFLIYLLPVFPFLAFQQYATEFNNQGLIIIAALLNIGVPLLLLPPFTVAISEICLGNRPSVIHSYKRVFAKGMGGYIGTYLLFIIVLSAGTLFFIIPGIIIWIWCIFTLQISVLEQVFGTKAFRRSKQLGKGFYWRNFGTSLLLYLVTYAAAVLLGMAFGAVSGFLLQLLLPEALDSLVMQYIWALVGAMLGHLVSPLPFIGVVLLYYDMRARKEAYDSAALAEDLMR